MPMSVVRFALVRFGVLVSEKLGVCPLCMRASALGSVLAWVVYGGIRAARLDPILPAALVALTLIVALAFTTLIAAHLAAYMVRVARRTRRSRDGRGAGASSNHAFLSRREFFGLILRAGAYAAATAFLGPFAAFGQANTCAGKREPGYQRTETASGATKEEALGAFRAKAEQFCSLLCEDLDCGTDGGCVREGPIVVSEPECWPGILGGVVCQGEVKQCTCGCKKCKGSHDPLVFGDHAWGLGASDAAARGDLPVNARTMCDKICARHKDCLPPKTCKRNGEPVLGEIKSWKSGFNSYEARARLIKCPCDCA